MVDSNLSPEEEELIKLEQDIELCRVKYDQYFLGIEKIPPELLRSKINKRILKSRLGASRKAGLRFRFLGLVQKLRSYEAMWDRMLRELETGKRSIKRYLRPETSTPVSNRQIELAQGVKSKEVKNDPVAKLYNDFVEARKKIGKDTTMDMESFRNKIKKLQQQLRDLRVEVRQNRVVIVGKKKKGDDENKKG